ncbi:hypothetical protein NDU88_008820 [Pleurodeles waltl]|uniref:Uncharacterized protein n=1 Tax=Pleurodeles waltl TaxID=8319 RepID=A0AAV7RYR5_PLEWA|nr:hypothetical protein NDU88_008820 [Pleurodeles waltl]
MGTKTDDQLQQQECRLYDNVPMRFEKHRDDSKKSRHTHLRTQKHHSLQKICHETDRALRHQQPPSRPYEMGGTRSTETYSD